MLESEIERRFREGVRALGGRSYKLVATEAGIPDRLVLLPGGRIRLVELKTETGQLSPRQRIWLAEAAALGVEVAVLHGLAEVLAWLDVQAYPGPPEPEGDPQ